MIKQTLIALSAGTILAGCSVPVMVAADRNQGRVTGLFEITVPASMLVVSEDGEELLTGELAGRASGSATLALTGPIWGACSFAMTRQGSIDGSCANGQTISEQAEPQRPSMSGTYVHEGQMDGNDYVMVMGWGNEATETSIRTALSAYRGPAET